jgi:RimJ/RimL family protein N-acetyltransferase
MTVELNKLDRGKGMGEACFRKACELSPYNVVHATTRKSNIAAQKVMLRAGFVQIENVKGAQVKLVWHRPFIEQAAELQ